MTSHTLDASSLRRLKRIVNARADQLVWDINAVYIVGPNETTKVEALAVTLESPQPDKFDEVFPITVGISNSGSRFDKAGEEGLAYRVAAEDVNITTVDIVRVAVQFPADKTVQASTVDDQAPGINVVDCGVLVHTDRGVLIAYQRHPGFGFQWGTHSPGELLPVDAVLGLLHPPYELIPLATIR